MPFVFCEFHLAFQAKCISDAKELRQEKHGLQHIFHALVYHVILFFKCVHCVSSYVLFFFAGQAYETSAAPLRLHRICKIIGDSTCPLRRKNNLMWLLNNAWKLKRDRALLFSCQGGSSRYTHTSQNGPLIQSGIYILYSHRKHQ